MTCALLNIHNTSYPFDFCFCHSYFTVVILLGSFASLWKAIISFVMSVCPHGTTRLPLDGFGLNLIFGFFFRKSVDKIQVSLKSDKNNGYFMWRLFTFMAISRWILLGMRTVLDKSLMLFFKKYEIWDNAEKFGGLGRRKFIHYGRRNLL
jgi:hypothetical protein